MTDLKALCTEIEAAARLAGEFIRNESLVFDIDDTETKGLNNFVTYVDKGSEKMLIEKLGPLIPEAGFIARRDFSKERSQIQLVIDPLDGTTNFLHGVHPYAVSIGLMEDNKVIAGVFMKQEVLRHSRHGKTEEPGLMEKGYMFQKLRNYLPHLQQLVFHIIS